MSGKRGTAPPFSRDGVIKQSNIEQIYATLRDSLPEFGLAGLRAPRRPKWRIAGGSLPHPDDIRAVLVRAAASLHALGRKHRELRAVERALTRFLLEEASLDRAFHYARRGRSAPRYRERIRGALVRSLAVFERCHRYSRRPELRYVRLALQRHLEFRLTLKQAFGYARAARGPAPHPEGHERQLARRAFEARFIIGRKANPAAYDAVNNTQARKALENHAVYVLECFEAERLEVLRQAQPELAERYASRQPGRPRAQLWSGDVRRRLMPYYRRHMLRYRPQSQ